MRTPDVMPLSRNTLQKASSRILGSFSVDDGDSSENVTFKLSPRFFRLRRVYFNSMKLFNVSEFPWS